MSTTGKWLRRSSVFVVGIGAVLGTSLTADAGNPPPTTGPGPGVTPSGPTPTIEMNTGVLLVKESLDGKVGRETGAGVMMAAVTPMAGNKLLMTWMDSDVARIDSGWQGKVAVVQMNQTSAPSVVVPQTQITKFNGERPFNHPAVSSNAAGTYAVIAFASTKEDGSNTREWAMVVDATGKVVFDAMKFGTDDGNTGGTTIYNGGKDTSGNDKFLVGYQHNNNESLVAGLTLSMANGMPTLKQTFNTEFYRPTNIGRPVIAVIDSKTATACTEVGDNRPPEYGIGCAVLDTNTGNIITGGGGDAVGKDVHNGIVAASHPDVDPKIYMNQASLALLPNGQCALGVVQSNGAGRNNNRGGANYSLLYQIDCKTLSVVSKTDPTTPVAPWQRHATLITSLYGSAGATFVGHIGCSSTGSGSAGVQMVNVDPAKGIAAIDKQSMLLPVSWACDSAWLANKGLRNPNDQGREFINALGSVPNPAYQVQGGWMPEASHFLISTVPFVRNHDKMGTGTGGGDGGGGMGDGGGMKYSADGGMEYQRNSLHLAFVPVAWDPKVQVVMSAAVDANTIQTGYSACLSNCGNTNDPSNPYSPNNPYNSGYGAHHIFGNPSAGGCGCIVGAGAGGAGTGFGALALAGLGIAAITSRRRRG